MSIKIFLDDGRNPDDFYTFEGQEFVTVRTVKEFKDILSGVSQVDLISFDHDLGHTDPESTGYEALCWVEERAFLGELEVGEIGVHTANMGAARKMWQAAKKITENVFRPSSKY